MIIIFAVCIQFFLTIFLKLVNLAIISLVDTTCTSDTSFKRDKLLHFFFYTTFLNFNLKPQFIYYFFKVGLVRLLCQLDSANVLLLELKLFSFHVSNKTTHEPISI